MKRAARGSGCVYQRGPDRWWIAFYANGKQHHERGGRTEKEAARLLRTKLAKVLCHQFIEPKNAKLTVNQLLDALAVHLETKGARSLGSFRSHVKPVREEFGHLRAVHITADVIETYQRRRLKEGFAPATVNRGVQAMRAAFHLARKQDRLLRVPHFPMLSERDNVRQGFFEAEEIETVLAALPPHVADVTRFGYLTGWRVGEITALTWSAVDLAAREVRLKTSKNGRPRSLPLAGPLWDLIERRATVRKFQPSDLVFGKVGDFRRQWQSVCVAAGLGRWLDANGKPLEVEDGRPLGGGPRPRYEGKLFHDLRRTAARDMIRAGVDRAVAKSITGHVTDSMFDRYNIVSQVDKAAALRKTATYRTGMITE